ncbi:MAG: HAD-IC family P-type ATPase, partial [bacterium]|nr:HAD-IC family P-type ATPase [bacterium]
HFEDEVKENVSELFRALSARGIRMKMLTGDKKENAKRLFGTFGIPILAECTPESKYREIEKAKEKGDIVVMVGDGLNDAPAFVHANVGIVFSGTENSASIEAANVVILGRDVMLIEDLFDTASRSVRIAGQSIWGGVALSSIGMIFAAFGFIPPIWGALTQEIIDVAVILNSLRASARQV